MYKVTIMACPQSRGKTNLDVLTWSVPLVNVSVAKEDTVESWCEDLTSCCRWYKGTGHPVNLELGYTGKRQRLPLIQGQEAEYSGPETTEKGVLRWTFFYLVK